MMRPNTTAKVLDTVTHLPAPSNLANGPQKKVVKNGK